jgi:hypothetical protein
LNTLALEDKWILSKYNNLVAEVTDNLDKYELGLAVQKLYDFIWDIFCDWYIEICKSRLNGTDENAKNTARSVLVYVFTNTFDNSFGIWVRMPQYSSQDGVFIEQRVMNDNFSVASTTNSFGSEFVWNGKNDVLVFHMNPTGRLYNAVNGFTLEAYSSNTDNNKSTGSPLAVQGPTGPYQAYISRTNSVQRADSHSVSLVEPLTNRWTISWWAKEDADEFANAKPETYLWSIGTIPIAAIKGRGYSSSGADANKISLWKVNNGKNCNLEIPDTQWHHYAYAADGTSIYSYRDGVFMQKCDNASYNFDYLEEFKGKVYLMSSSDPNKDAFRGCVDEFRLESYFGPAI